ncbi:MAG: outer membrane beta-barrel protein [Flavobacteriales bacterium]|nr:outer membrane beta-barrel protein [Flavobacteriales bacterium]MEB2342182.1 outer membrane beta-barrel protein [Flavobacteriia bacterium]
MHRYLLFALLAAIACPTLLAQPGPRGQRPRGQVYGKLLDDQRKPVPFASVSILQRDSLVGGALGQENGFFEVPNLPFGNLTVKVAAMGYSPYAKDFKLTADQTPLDLGNIRVNPDAVLLHAAEVTKERATQVLQVDRRVYNVEKDISVVGGDATDVMKNIPGLSVDADGNVEMRGRSPRVFVDGRPTMMTLEQIAAADIERVEVITNPSAAFDADATGGIVNVVMKKITRPGFSGQVQAGAGTDDRYNMNASLMVRQGRSSFNAGIGFGSGRPPGTGYSNRTDLADGLPTGFFNQTSRRTTTFLRQNARLGWDYKLNMRNTISLMQSVHGGNRDSDERQDFTNRDAAHTVTGSGVQHNLSEGKYRGLTSRAGFRRTTTKPGKEWGTDLTFNLSDRRSPASTEQFNTGDIGFLPHHSMQRRASKGQGQEWTWQLDVSDAYADNRKLEWGFKANYEREESRMDVTNENDTLPVARVDTFLSNAYVIRTFINAAYINWSTKLSDHWSMQSGLRVEQNAMQAERTDKGLSFSYNYPDGLDDLGRILFPSIYLSRKWDAAEGTLQRELQVNVSRKVNRPNHWQLMPFIMPVDARSYRQGNPVLLPEMSTVVEVNHLLPFGEKGNWLSSAYARFTSNVITSYIVPMPNDADILLTSYLNGDRNQGYGWENTVKLTLWNGLEATLNGNIQWVEIGLTTGGRSLSNTGVNYNAKGNLSQKLPQGWTVQVNGDYDGPRVIPQGHTLERYSMDVTVRKDIGKHFFITASAQNIFDSRGWGSYYDMPAFRQENYSTWGSRAFLLSATWRFGKSDVQFFRRNRQGSPERNVPGTGGGDDGGME